MNEVIIPGNCCKAEMSTIRIGDRPVGADKPTYIIAEIGINHNGDLRIAEKLVQAAAEAQVDAVKFQKRHLASLYKADVLQATEKYEQNFQYMIPILKAVELADENFLHLKNLCLAKGVEFLCTPFDIPSVDFLSGLGVNAFKIASADLNNLELLEYVADLSKPMILSTGMSYWKEIEQAVDLIRRKETPFALLHCRSVYPVWPREVNLSMIDRLRSFGCPVGYSGHDIGITIPLVAASMGACIIEKHITLDRAMRGPDHKISLEPYELKRLVRDIRVADQALERQNRFLLRGEILNRELFSKSLLAGIPIKAGTRITSGMIKVQGPGKGLSPNRRDDLIGQRIQRDMAPGDFFLEEDISGGATLDSNYSFRSRWGLISRFSDMEAMLAYHPKVIEFHLAEQDFEMQFVPQDINGQVMVLHAPEYVGDRLLDLCSASDEIRASSIAMVQKSIDLAKSIAPSFSGTPKVIVHPGAMSLNTKLDSDRLQAALLRSLREIRQDGIELLLENLPPYPWYFGGQWKGCYFIDPDEIADFCRTAGIDICFDLSHAALYCNAKSRDLKDFIATLKPFIRHIHFADAYGLDGEGVQIGEGDIDFDQIMPLFNDYNGTWVPEIWRGHLQGGLGFRVALQRLKEYDL